MTADRRQPKVDTRKRYKRPRRYTETVDFIAMVARLVRAAGKRVSTADMDELRALVDLRTELDDVIESAVIAVMDNGGYSWQDIGETLGISRQAAWKRYGQKATR